MVSHGVTVALADDTSKLIEDICVGDLLKNHAFSWHPVTKIKCATASAATHESGLAPRVIAVVKRTLPGYSFIATAAPGLAINSRAYMKIGGIWAHPTSRYQANPQLDAVVYDVFLEGTSLSYMAGGHEIAAANHAIYESSRKTSP